MIPFSTELAVLFDSKKKAAAKLAAIFTIVVKMTKDFNEVIGKIGERFGALGLQNEAFRQGVLGSRIEATKLGKELDDVNTTIATLTNEFGFGLDRSVKLASSVTVKCTCLVLRVME